MSKAMKDTMGLLAAGMKDSISQELVSKGIPLVPLLKLFIQQGHNNETITLESQDIHRLFSFYGEVLNVTITDQEATIHYKSIVSAYFAQKTLNNKHIPDLNITLIVTWNSSLPTSRVLFPLKKENPKEPLENSFKYTCKFEIEIENSNEFQVSRRIIGPKGKNMKKILEICMQGGVNTGHDTVKLRLRGKGSGFKEGPANQESEEPLHLCVSSKFFDKFQIACIETEKLISLVYLDYSCYLKKRGINAVIPSIKKYNCVL